MKFDIVRIVLFALLLMTGCNSGQDINKNTNSAADEHTAKDLAVGVNDGGGFVFNLSDSELMGINQKYAYQIKYLGVKDIELIAPMTQFNCTGYYNCSIRLDGLKMYGGYVIELFDSKEKFIGAAMFNYLSPDSERVFSSFHITPTTTGQYMVRLLSKELNIDDGDIFELLEQSMQQKSKGGKSNYDLVYFGFNKLIIKEGATGDGSVTNVVNKIKQQLQNKKASEDFNVDSEQMELEYIKILESSFDLKEKATKELNLNEAKAKRDASFKLITAMVTDAMPGVRMMAQEKLFNKEIAGRPLPIFILL